MQKIKMISCGANHTSCVDENGNLWTFGYNEFGQLGLGNTVYRNSANKVPGISNVKTLSKGSSAYSCIVQCEDNSLWVFGWNICGQLGLGNTKKQESPQRLDEKWEEIVSNFKSQRVKSARSILECCNEPPKKKQKSTK